MSALGTKVSLSMFCFIAEQRNKALWQARVGTMALLDGAKGIVISEVGTKVLLDGVAKVMARAEGKLVLGDTGWELMLLMLLLFKILL